MFYRIRVLKNLQTFYRISVLKNFPEFTGKHLCRPRHRWLPVNFSNFLRTPFFFLKPSGNCFQLSVELLTFHGYFWPFTDIFHISVYTYTLNSLQHKVTKMIAMTPSFPLTLNYVISFEIECISTNPSVFLLTRLRAILPFYSPGNIRKLLFFRCFHGGDGGGWNRNISLRWVNDLEDNFFRWIPIQLVNICSKLKTNHRIYLIFLCITWTLVYLLGIY